MNGSADILCLAVCFALPVALAMAVIHRRKILLVMLMLLASTAMAYGKGIGRGYHSPVKLIQTSHGKSYKIRNRKHGLR